MKLYISSDHAGFELKRHLVEYLGANGIEVVDKGPFDYDPHDDYTDWISLVADEVSKNPGSARGIVIGLSGQGEAMAANKFLNVRAALFYGLSVVFRDSGDDKTPDPYEIIRLAREHNDANVLSIGAKFVSKKEAEKAVDIWIDTQFSNEERHKRRIDKLNTLGHD